MEEKLPTKHLSARVPWHDNKWSGTTCKDVLNNSFCRILKKIDGEKDPENEKDNKKITDKNFPPCISEKGTFLSPYEYSREIVHAYSEINKLYKNMGPATYHHKPFSFNAIPFRWMMKTPGNFKANSDLPFEYPHRSLKAEIYGLDYKTELEEEIDKELGFQGNIWVQHPENQKVLLNSFFNCLQPKSSLIFFYCKHTPLSDPNERVIVGVAKVRNKIGKALEYSYPAGYTGNFSMVWDRCVEHTLTDKNKDGILLPYHEILSHIEKNGLEEELKEFVAFAPNFDQYSYASELVEHDTAIDSLLAVADSLKRAESLLGKSFSKELKWVDNEISKVWDMRGVYPGMGPVLSALKIEQGNTIAWEIEKYIVDNDGDLLKTDPWQIFEDSFLQPTKYLKYNGAKLFNPTIQRIWKSIPQKKKTLYKLFSRIQIDNNQAKFLVEDYSSEIATTDELIKNLYLIYEKTAYKYKDLFSFHLIDKALFPPEKYQKRFPLPSDVSLTDQLDERRVRALSTWVLEKASSEGHTLLPLHDVLQRMESISIDTPFPINEDILLAQAELSFFHEQILMKNSDSHVFLKLARLDLLKDIIQQRINLSSVHENKFNIEKNWINEINKSEHIPKLKKNAPDYDDEMLARNEKAEALNILTNFKFSVLIGPAGSGKTSLLKIFESQPEIQKGGLLKLAPTGKARVKLGHDAKTIAQFLFPERYNAFYGIYCIDDKASKYSSARNVIIDEASMLTEEQLAAVLDKLGPMDRIILVGDYRQLPPIGSGRPFVDIVSVIKPKTFKKIDIRCGPAYAELRQIRRQSGIASNSRIDVSLSRCFSDEPTADDLDVFREVSKGKYNSEHLRLEKWYDTNSFNELLQKVINSELGLKGKDAIKIFNRTLGATDNGDYQYFNHDHSEKMIENWQIISPVNGFAHGIKEINKQIQKTYRSNFIKLALSKWKKNIAKPKGNDNFVYGDKVINLRNSTWNKWQNIYPQEKKETALNYIANGEIGVVTGFFKGKAYASMAEPDITIAFSTQPGYSYIFKPWQFNDESRKSYSVDLAYAITVHKAQGSGFKKVFFVLPAKGAILSRELLYTALTRQEEKIIILHQGEFRDFIRLSGSDASATAKRFTDLFDLPEVKQLENKFYDSRYINVSERGEKMISKNEVIIANCLNKYKKQLSYAYEDKLKLEKSGRIIKPDFVIECLKTGKVFYWEHLGMMNNENYRKKWEKKLKAYKEDGFVLFDKVKTKDDKILILTEENPAGGVDSKYFDDIVKNVILK